MNTRPSIYQIVYRNGMVANSRDRRGLRTMVLEKADISNEIVDAIFDNNLLTVEGVRGIPDVGEPVQIDSLKIIHALGTTEITVYNLAIMLFLSNDEVFPRIHRVLCAIDNQTRSRQIDQIDANYQGTGAGNQALAVREKKYMPKKSVKNVVTNSAPQKPETVHQLKVVLLETHPPVWRRFVVPSNVTLHRLHLILQEVMGWTNSHLYRFKIEDREYGEPDPDNEFYELDFKNSRQAKLERLVMEKGSNFRYEYDFGDGWIHKLVVEDILERESDQSYPICLAGKRACPPEDCGGTYGYTELLAIIKDPSHEQYQDMMTWLGGHFDSEVFNITELNNKLSSIRLR